MRIIGYIAYKSFRKIYRMISKKINKIRLLFFLYIYNVKHKKISSNGFPFFQIAKNAIFEIGYNFKMNNYLKYNAIGFPQPCTFVVNEGCKLIIGNHVGISQTAIICQQEIIIKDYVKMGGGVKIYDSDFHSLSAKDRMLSATDMENKKTKSV